MQYLGSVDEALGMEGRVWKRLRNFPKILVLDDCMYFVGNIAVVVVMMRARVLQALGHQSQVCTSQEGVMIHKHHNGRSGDILAAESNWWIRKEDKPITVTNEQGEPTSTYRWMGWVYKIHLTLRNINPHNATHSLISRNPRERMFVVQISLLIVTFLFLISQILSLVQTTQEVNPHPRIASCVNMLNVTFLFLLVFFFLCHLLNVDACICHMEGQVEWTTSHHWNVALCVIPKCHMLHQFHNIMHPS